ncbi:MAG: AAA family ATPase [Albidovulum sp.]|nr:AAA family ATPase [Albidovulum sp.]
MSAMDFDAHAVRAIESIKDGKNVFITGKAGTGKSTLLRYCRDNFLKSAVVLAPTGVAALNVQGQTIHRFFGFGIAVSPNLVRKNRIGPRGFKKHLFKKLKTIIIDEISMVRADLLDCVDIFLRKHGPNPRKPFGGVQMVFFGDLFQLSPVVRNDEKGLFPDVYESPYFFSSTVIGKSELEVIELESIYRQSDQAFKNLLDKIRNSEARTNDLEVLDRRIDRNFEAPEGEFFITLTATNANAEHINEAKLRALPGDERVSRASITGKVEKDSFPTAEILRFKIGSQIMMLNNDTEGRWVNGSVGELTSIAKGDDGNLVVKAQLRDNDELVSVERHSWDVIEFVMQNGEIVPKEVGVFEQLPFRLAWAVTIHKCQGLTFDKVVVDLDRVFGFGQAYVALSRCTAIEGIILSRSIGEESIRTDYRVQKFFADRKIALANKRRPVSEKLEQIRNAIESGVDLEILYLKGNNTESRHVVSPIEVGDLDYKGVVYQGMRARCSKADAVLNFNVNRIIEMESAGT